MKRDLDLIRKILLIREGSDKYVISAEDIDQNNLLSINYNIGLLKDAGYIITEPASFRVIEDGDRQIPIEIYGIIRMTNSGHDYLDSVRDPKIYRQVKDRLKSTVQSVSLEIVKTIADSLILKSLGF